MSKEETMIKPKEMCATIEDWWKLKDHGCFSKCELMITAHFVGGVEHMS
jgi:hypothetical protein